MFPSNITFGFLSVFDHMLMQAIGKELEECLWSQHRQLPEKPTAREDVSEAKETPIALLRCIEDKDALQDEAEKIRAKLRNAHGVNWGYWRIVNKEYERHFEDISTSHTIFESASSHTASFMGSIEAYSSGAGSTPSPAMISLGYEEFHAPGMTDLSSPAVTSTGIEQLRAAGMSEGHSIDTAASRAEELHTWNASDTHQPATVPLGSEGQSNAVPAHAQPKPKRKKTKRKAFLERRAREEEDERRKIFIEEAKRANSARSFGTNSPQQRQKGTHSTDQTEDDCKDQVIREYNDSNSMDNECFLPGFKRTPGAKTDLMF